MTSEEIVAIWWTSVVWGLIAIGTWHFGWLGGWKRARRIFDGSKHLADELEKSNQLQKDLLHQRQRLANEMEKHNELHQHYANEIIIS